MRRLCCAAQWNGVAVVCCSRQIRPAEAEHAPGVRSGASESVQEIAFVAAALESGFGHAHHRTRPSCVWARRNMMRKGDCEGMLVSAPFLNVTLLHFKLGITRLAREIQDG